MGDGVPRHVVVVFSGGLDSTTLAYRLHAEGFRLTLLSVDYGQRHRRELDCAGRVAELLRSAHEMVDLRSVGALLTGSALTDETVEVPDGCYSDATVASTIVANRNAFMLDVATAVAAARGAEAVAFGAHGGDHVTYPDCRPAFVNAYADLVHVANEGLLPAEFRVMAPFGESSKADIVGIGARLGVPFEFTWSCYRGGAVHCGRCGTCLQRRDAFAAAGVPDPTRYDSATERGQARGSVPVS